MVAAPWVLLFFSCAARQDDLGDSVSGVVKGAVHDAIARHADEIIHDLPHSPNWLMSPHMIFPVNATVNHFAKNGSSVTRQGEQLVQAVDSIPRASNSSLARIVLADRGANVTAAMDRALHNAFPNATMQERQLDPTVLLRSLNLRLPNPAEANQTSENSTVTSSLLRALSVPMAAVKRAPGNSTENASSPATWYYESFLAWLRSKDHQGVIVATIVTAGAFCAWDGPGVWRVLFTFMGAVMVASIAHLEMGGTAMAANRSAEVVVLLQVAGSTALAIHCGFEGSQVMLGAILGCIGAYSCDDWVRSIDEMMPAGPGLAVFWYAAGSGAGMMLCTLWRKSVLVMLGPLIGGLCLASGVGMLISRMYAALPDDGDCRIAGCLLPLPPPDAPWVDVAKALLGPFQRSGLPVHCACAVTAMLVHRCGNGRQVWVAIACLNAYILLSALAAFDCPLQKTRQECQSSAAVQFWEWRVAGCFLWALITSCSAWRQLRALKTAEDTARNYGGLPTQSPSHHSHSALPNSTGFVPLQQPDVETRFFVTPDAPPSLSQWLTVQRSSGNFLQKLGS